MKTRLVASLVVLVTAAGAALAGPGACGCAVATVAVPPITLYYRPQPGPASYVPPVQMPPITLHPEVPLPPTWGPPKPPQPITLLVGSPPPVELISKPPPLVQLVRGQVQCPRWVEAPPMPTVTLLRQVPACPVSAPPVQRPGVTLFQQPQPPCPAWPACGCVRP
jgi:hypothetical protein